MSNQFDYRCPRCGDTDQIDVCADAWVRLTDDGTDADASHNGSHLWNSDSLTRCAACGHIADAHEFDPDAEPD